MPSIKRENSVILTHEHSDFDALAAMLGASLLFPGAVPILPRQLNRNVRDFVTLYKNQLPFVAPEDVQRKAIRQVILVDTRAASLPKGVRKDAAYLIIDHHQSPLQALSSQKANSSEHHESWVEAVGATTTLLVERLIEQQIRPAALQATLLALGIHEDTGSLTYASTTARDVRALAWLLDCGASLPEISHFLHHPMSDEQRRLLEQLITHSETLEIAGHSVVVAQASAEGFQEEISVLAGRLRDFFESDVLFLMVYLGDIVQVVARSSTDAIDVGEIARTLGGGGHRRAAAAPIHHVTLAEVRRRLLHALEQQSRSGITVGQIMSVGRPQMLEPDMRIDEAIVLMRRYGHEGFPVVEKSENGDSGNEKLLGVLTRREADRAENHGLHKEPVRRFMRAGSITVRADDPVSQLRHMMVEHDWGQIPVVNAEAQIIGIVTRTDLIKLWDENALPERSAAEMAGRMAAALSPTHHHILQLIGKEAAANGKVVYVVGGFVRDLLLISTSAAGNILQGSTSQNELGEGFDLDIVIEGDAIHFAHHMQRKFGGRVVIHRQFGTAKWLLQDEDAPLHLSQLLAALELSEEGRLLPPSLDFVSARTEFYTAPTVLPTVESSSIKLDLHRRDFTINTLALCLNPNRWGTLLDFYGGVNDLQKGLVRVLHSLSFIDDPTRILRAVRYEQRFSFHIEERTLELLGDALDLLERVSAARIRHELQRIFQESAPEQTLLRLSELGVLARLHPELTSDGWLVDCFVRLRSIIAGKSAAPEWVQSTLQAEPIWRLYWGLMTFRLSASALHKLDERLQWDKATQRLVVGLHDVESRVEVLQQPLQRPSRITAILEKADLPALALFGAAHANDPILPLAVERYHDEWKDVRPIIGGEDLAAMQIERGPIYRHLLEQLRSGWLDGEVASREDEEKRIAQILAGTVEPSEIRVPSVRV